MLRRETCWRHDTAGRKSAWQGANWTP